MTRREARRVVIWLGGNDIRSNYGNFYDGGSPTTWINRVSSDIIYVRDYCPLLK